LKGEVMKNLKELLASGKYDLRYNKEACIVNEGNNLEKAFTFLKYKGFSVDIWRTNLDVEPNEICIRWEEIERYEISDYAKDMQQEVILALYDRIIDDQVSLKDLFDLDSIEDIDDISIIDYYDVKDSKEPEFFRTYEAWRFFAENYSECFEVMGRDFDEKGVTEKNVALACSQCVSDAVDDEKVFEKLKEMFTVKLMKELYTNAVNEKADAETLEWYSESLGYLIRMEEEEDDE
jgi:hypothetical protein